MTARKRILEYIESRGISRYKFYKDVGVSNGYLDKEGNVGSDICEKISYRYPDLSIEWLIAGKGDMLKAPPKEYTELNTVNTVGEPKTSYNDEFKDKYIRQLETTNKQLLLQVSNLEKELLNKQDIIKGFMEGSIVIAPHSQGSEKNTG